MQTTEPTIAFTEAVRSDALPRLPLRGSIDLTYRCNNACSHCYVAPERRNWDATRELDTGNWKHILDILLEHAIPHVTFWNSAVPAGLVSI